MFPHPSYKAHLTLLTLIPCQNLPTSPSHGLPTQSQQHWPSQHLWSAHLTSRRVFRKLTYRISSSLSSCNMTHFMFVAIDLYLSYITARAITMPFQHGFPPTRWYTAIQFKLKEESGNHLITKLRVIQNLEVGMSSAFMPSFIPLNFGNRSGSRFHSTVLQEPLSYDFIHYSCLNTIISTMTPWLALKGSFPPLVAWLPNVLAYQPLLSQ